MSSLLEKHFRSFTLVVCILLVGANYLVIYRVQGVVPVETSDNTWWQQGREVLTDLQQGEPIRARARSVILFVGDGMGISTVTAARIFAGQQLGQDGESYRLAFETFPYTALSVTASDSQQTPDSAPTATAMTTGIKTRGGAIAVDAGIDSSDARAESNRARAVTTLLEYAETKGLGTGIVSTARITHATPAANYAHVASRSWESDTDLPPNATVKDIARQLIEFESGDGIDVILGGGRRPLLPTSATDPEYPQTTGKRQDGRNLIEEWQQRHPNGQFVWNAQQFAAIQPQKTQKLLGLFETSHMQYEADRQGDKGGEPSLAEMTEAAIKILQQHDEGYYLMVEAGRIDHAHHGGNARRALEDTVALSDAVAKAESLTGDDTLIVVTADHSHVFTLAGYPDRGNPILGKVHHHGKLSRDKNGLPYTTLSYANGPGHREGKSRPDLTHTDTGKLDFRQEALVPMESETHGGEDVAIYARGPNAHLFRGTLEQHLIFHIIADALHLPIIAPVNGDAR